MHKRNRKFCYVLAFMLSWVISSQVLAQDAIQVEPVVINAESDISTFRLNTSTLGLGAPDIRRS